MCPDKDKIKDEELARYTLTAENVVYHDNNHLSGGLISGNTDNNWSTVLRWNCLNIVGHKRVSIQNTHATNALEYKIITSGLSDESTPQTISPTSIDTNLYKKDEVVTDIKVLVKNHLAGDNSSYRIEVFGLRK